MKDKEGVELKAWLKSNFDYDHIYQIPMSQYDEICTALQKFGEGRADEPPKAKGKPGPKSKKKQPQPDPVEDEEPWPTEESD